MPVARACDQHFSLAPGLAATSAAGSVSGPALSTSASAGGGSLDVPAYHSLPGAFAAIYLDFDGDFTPSWHGYEPGLTPAYSTDADATSFSAQELTNVHEIWSRVSEKFSPFNLNVTTVDPGDRDDRKTLHVVIGGDGRNGASDYWVGFRAGGVAWQGGFYTSHSNTVFVFPGNLENGDPKRVGEVSSHEPGHGFGLAHQSLYGPQGQFLAEYNPGDAQRAPVMGRSYDAARGLWWRGPTITVNTIQDDLLDISSPSTNGFGYRADDHGNTIGGATALSQDGNDAWSHGIIEQTSDADYFTFDTLAGDVAFTLDVAPFGAMLDASLALYDSTGLLLVSSATSSLSESLSLTLPGGTYALAVTSAAHYGDIGQYFLTGTIVAVPEPSSLAPLALAAAAVRRRRRR
jgi:hypothetical protein